MKNIVKLFVFSFALVSLCNCSKSKSESSLVPSLVSAAEEFNEKSDYGRIVGPKGNSAIAEYEDSVYRIIQYFDENITSPNEISLVYKDNLEKLKIQISLSEGYGRELYKCMVDNNVYYEHVFMTKGTKEIFERFTLKPSEISDALNTKYNVTDLLKFETKEMQNILPKQMGYILVNNIEYNSGVVKLYLYVDEVNLSLEEALIPIRNAKSKLSEDLLLNAFSPVYLINLEKSGADLEYVLTGLKSKRSESVIFNNKEIAQCNEKIKKILEEKGVQL